MNASGCEGRKHLLSVDTLGCPIVEMVCLYTIVDQTYPGSENILIVGRSSVEEYVHPQGAYWPCALTRIIYKSRSCALKIMCGVGRRSRIRVVPHTGSSDGGLGVSTWPLLLRTSLGNQNFGGLRRPIHDHRTVENSPNGPKSS